MLVVAMAFAWCVISAEKPGKDPAPRVEAPVTASPASNAEAQAAVGTPTADGVRTPIRSAIPAEVIAFAKTLVNLPMGSEQVEEIDGQRYVFVLERHYHPPGFVGAPVGWHKGVTAYELH
jgi:hypothetical protein